MTKVLFASLDDPPPAPYELGYLASVQKECLDNPHADFSLCEDPEVANLIVLLENHEFKNWRHIKRLKRSRLLADYPGKVFTLNYEDAPSGALTGLYTSLRPDQYHEEIHRSWPHVGLPNEMVYAAPVKNLESARFLFSFRGNFSSHPIRKEMGRLYAKPSKIFKVEEIDRWYNHSNAEKESYIQLIQDAIFALCPRGLSPYSHRIGEVMALGRVPVIISDCWTPFSFEETEPYYVRIAEADLPRIPEILQERRSDATTLAANARKLFQNNLSIGNRFPMVVKMMAKLQSERGSDWMERYYSRRWSSRQFWRSNGWTLEQRFVQKGKKWLGRG